MYVGRKNLFKIDENLWDLYQTDKFLVLHYAP